MLLGPDNEWPTPIKSLIYKDNGLAEDEQDLINSVLNKKGLYLFVNLRYPPDPVRYEKMTKKGFIEGTHLRTQLER